MQHYTSACGSKGDDTSATTEPGRDKAVAATKPSTVVDTAKPSASDPFVITINKDLGSLIKTHALRAVEVLDLLRLAGRLELNGYKTARIGAPMTGRISDFRTFIGPEVRQGEALAEMNSQELTSVQLDFLKAHSA